MRGKRNQPSQRTLFHRASRGDRTAASAPLLAALLVAAVWLAVASPPAIFSDKTTESGIDFVHFNGMSGELYYCEMVGSGAALFDYDNDGDLDLYLVQGAMLGPGKTLKDALFPAAKPGVITDRLFRNDLIGRNGTAGKLHFTDVTEQSGIRETGYGMGVAAGDYNNDGWVDLYVTNFGPNRMFRNNGDGTFTDVIAQTGTDDPRWSVSAAFFDYDRDGRLDLYVGNYVDFRFTNQKRCFSATGRPDYCGPLSFEPQPERLFRNLGDGTFQDVSAASHIGREANGALGVVTGDFNQDGWIDLYIANDGRGNHLWMNQRDGTFSNEAMLAGAALNADGRAESSMGVDAGDFDSDGDEDLLITNLVNEGSTLYSNNGQGWFEDRSYAVGLRTPSLPYTGFGTAFIDYDNDGRLDIFTANGEVRLIEALVLAKDPYPLHQRKQLFRNPADGRFREVSREGGPVFEISEVSRGAGFGDIDNDGDEDILVVNNNGPAKLLLNNLGNRNHWVGLRMVGRDGKRDRLGTWVMVHRDGQRPLGRRVRTDGSYASANDPRLLFGLGQTPPRSVTVQAFWLGGRAEQWQDVPIDRYTTLREGSGQPFSGTNYFSSQK